jgi:uncharacterized protein (TIGR03067 family)
MTATLASLLTCAALAAPVPVDDPTGDLKTLQGTWEATIRGPLGQSLDITFLVEDDNFTMSMTTPDGEERQIKGEIKLDEKADPKQIDLTPKEAKPDGPGPKDTMKGLYKVEEDTFTLYPSSGPDSQRPTEYAEDDGGDGPPKRIKFKKKQKEKEEGKSSGK